MKLIIALSLAFLLLLGCVQEPQQNNKMEEKLEELEQKVDEMGEDLEDVEERVEDLEEEVQILTDGEVVEEEPEAGPPKGTVRFLVTVENIHDSQTLSPGVFVVHKPLTSINYIGKLAPPELEPLAEYGDYTAFKEYVEGKEDILRVYTIDQSLAPGEKTTFTMDISTYMPRESYLSGIMMAVGSNDGYASLNNVALFNPGNGPKNSTTNAHNYDAGTEQNEFLMSGFEGGQPDPTRGEENIDNGTPTVPQQPVTFHTQLSDPIMRVTVTTQ